MALGKLILTLMIIGIMSMGLVGCYQEQPGGSPGQTTSSAVQEQTLATQPTAPPVEQKDLDQVKKKLNETQPAQQ